jgi:LacI family transcriptional regulator
MRDVATEAGVSVKTVSRVVNRDPVVAAATAARVQAAIRRLGFRRDEMARALRTGGQSRMLGLVIKDLANPFYSAIARGVEEVMRGRSELVITGSSDEDPLRERELALQLCERRVDGLLIVPSGDDHSYLLPELELGMQVVFIDRLAEGIEADTVLLDNVGGSRAGVDYLLGLGHRRIAMVGDDPTIFTARERRSGFCEALTAAGIEPDPALVRIGAHDTAAAAEVTRELLALPNPPTALFAGNNRIATGVLRALAVTGRELALVSFDDLELADLLSMPVTAVAYDAAELGRCAAQLLARRLDGDTGPPELVVLPTTLIPRGAPEAAAA